MTLARQLFDKGSIRGVNPIFPQPFPWLPLKLSILRKRVGSASLLVCWVTSNYLHSTSCHDEIGVAESRGTTIIPVFAEAHITGSALAYVSRWQTIVMDDQRDFDNLVAQRIALIN